MSRSHIQWQNSKSSLQFLRQRIQISEQLTQGKVVGNNLGIDMNVGCYWTFSTWCSKKELRIGRKKFQIEKMLKLEGHKHMMLLDFKE